MLSIIYLGHWNTFHFSKWRQPNRLLFKRYVNYNKHINIILLAVTIVAVLTANYVHATHFFSPSLTLSLIFLWPALPFVHLLTISLAYSFVAVDRVLASQLWDWLCVEELKLFSIHGIQTLELSFYHSYSLPSLQPASLC